MRTTTRTNEHNPADNFRETTVGDAPSSVSLSLNAKGAVQWEIKLYYASPVEMHDNVQADLTAIDEDIKQFLIATGYKLAGA